MPKDEYQHVLGYLSPKDKKNLKLASRQCERRVMAYDPSMRKWKITVKASNCYEDIILPLAKARSKHINNEMFDEIEIEIKYHPDQDMHKEDIEKMMLFTEVILNNWKNNIVKLTTFIYGKEFFLLDPEFKLPKLQDLILLPGHFSKYEKDTNTNKKVICSAMIQNHADTLENLALLDIKAKVIEPLKLKKLQVFGFNSDSLSSFLHNTSKTLEILQMSGPVEESLTMICCPELKLRKLMFYSDARYLPPNSLHMISVLKACQKTLKVLIFQGINIGLKDEINSVHLVCLEKLEYTKSNVVDLPVMLRAISSTLKDLELNDVILPEETMTFDDDLQLSLEKFVGKSIPENLTASIINASMKTLTVLRLESVKDVLQDLIVDKLQLKELYLESVHSNTVAKLISASEDLEELTLMDILCLNEIDNKLLKLKQLNCENTCLHLTENLTKLAKISLTKLAVHFPPTCNCALRYKYDLDNLMEFHCTRGSSEYVSKILNSSSKTLKYLRIFKILGSQFNLENPLSLRLFKALDIDTATVKLVLLQQSATLNRFVWTNKKGNQAVDSIFLRVLLEFRANNPHCLVEIYDEESDSEIDEN